MENKTSINHDTANGTKPVLSAGVVSEIADQFEEQVRLEKLHGYV